MVDVVVKRGFTGRLTPASTLLAERLEALRPSAVCPVLPKEVTFTRGAYDIMSGIPGHEKKDALDISVRGLTDAQVLEVCRVCLTVYTLCRIVRPGQGNGAWHIHAESPFTRADATSWRKRC